jgi:hypothetical protein
MAALHKSVDAANAGGPPGREQLEAIRNDSDNKIYALLNDDQKTKFAAWQRERNARMERSRKPNNRTPAPPQ